MATNLLTFAQAAAALPDNSANLISPQNVRSAVLSATSDAAEVGENGPFTLALVAGVPTNINLASPNPDSEVLTGWIVDGNNALVPNQGAFFDIADGLERGISITFSMVGQNDGVGDDSFKFDMLKGAVVIESIQAVLAGGAAAEDQSIVFNAMELYEPKLQEPWSVQVTSGNGEDLALISWDLKVIGMMT